MSVYAIVTYDVADQKVFESYVPGVLPLLKRHGAEILVADFAAQGLEGRTPGVNVILRFESEESAMNWYNDPDYAPVRKIRLDSTTNGSMVLTKEFVMPAEPGA